MSSKMFEQRLHETLLERVRLVKKTRARGAYAEGTPVNSISIGGCLARKGGTSVNFSRRMASHSMCANRVAYASCELPLKLGCVDGGL